MTMLLSLLSRFRAAPNVRLVPGSLEGPLFGNARPSSVQHTVAGRLSGARLKRGTRAV